MRLSRRLANGEWIVSEYADGTKTEQFATTDGGVTQVLKCGPMAANELALFNRLSANDRLNMKLDPWFGFNFGPNSAPRRSIRRASRRRTSRSK